MHSKAKQNVHRERALIRSRHTPDDGAFGYFAALTALHMYHAAYTSLVYVRKKDNQPLLGRASGIMHDHMQSAVCGLLQWDRPPMRRPLSKAKDTGKRYWEGKGYWEGNICSLLCGALEKMPSVY